MCHYFGSHLPSWNFSRVLKNRACLGDFYNQPQSGLYSTRMKYFYKQGLSRFLLYWLTPSHIPLRGPISNLEPAFPVHLRPVNCPSNQDLPKQPAQARSNQIHVLSLSIRVADPRTFLLSGYFPWTLKADVFDKIHDQLLRCVIDGLVLG